MSRYSQRPENALKRANEFIEVGKPARALDTLYEVFRNKKWAYNWSESVLEPIMFKYLDLCVELKKSHIAKEGLFQYRNMFQAVNVGSLENVIRGYLRSAEEKTETAREHSQQAVIDIDDLDNLATPESILLSAVSGEGVQDRSDRTILTPWVKFLWESYCQCLELLRTNAHVETLYHDIAKMAYAFCLKYNRKTEFRKLCDKLRKHLEDIAKLTPQTVNVSLSKPETQQYNLDTRLVQLDYAIQMELWQEAYKATEDIHSLMNMAKKTAVPKTMANYYQKLAMVFWKAGPNYYLFHAVALFKFLHLHKEMKKNITADELQRMANRVLLAALAVPLPSAHPEFDRFIETDKSPVEKAQKLAVLLSLNQTPTRASFLRDLVVRYNVVNMASPAFQELYNWLEVNFNPLRLCEKVDGIIGKELKEADAQYVQPLRDITLVTLIRQVSQVYNDITYARLLQLSHFGTQFHLERLLVECVRQNDMQILIDHGKGCIYFAHDLTDSQSCDVDGGVKIQSMPSEQIRNQLTTMESVLRKCYEVVKPEGKRVEADSAHPSLLRYYRQHKDAEHQRVLGRHKIIEERKEYLEQINTVREREEAKRVEELAKQQALAEQKRLDMEREERERKRHENELQLIRDRTLKEKMQQISMTAHGQKILKNLPASELKTLDAEKIAVREAEELQRERKEQQQKLKVVERRMDYFERAKRLEEIPLLKQAWKEKEIADRKFWEQQEADKIQAMKQERKLALAHRERLARMEGDRVIFVNNLKAKRASLYQERLKKWELEMEAARKHRLEMRRKKRTEEREAEYKKRLEEEEEQRRAEEKRKKEEEERKKKQAELEREKEEHRKKMENLDRIAQLQMEREREIEMKQQMEAAAAYGKRVEGPAAVAGGPSDNKWRKAQTNAYEYDDYSHYDHGYAMTWEQYGQPSQWPPVTLSDHNYSVLPRRTQEICEICGAKFRDARSLKVHTNSKHLGLTKSYYKCLKCEKEFSHNNSLKNHLKKIHEGVNLTKTRFKCGICGKLFQFKQTLLNHEKLHTGDKPFQCSFCNKGFAVKQAMTIHEGVHTGIKPYQCDTCGVCFRVKDSLTNHERIHTGVKPYQCQICGKCFRLKHHLNLHALTHNKEKSYQCDFCGKAFRLKQSLKNHILIHVGEKANCCEFCDKKFIFKHTLRDHVRIHTGEKPYQCKFCGNCYSMRGSLNCHMRLHTGEKPHRCKFCNESFRWNTSMMLHIVRVHENNSRRWRENVKVKTYHCDVCGKNYDSKSSFDDHLRTHTGKKPLQS